MEIELEILKEITKEYFDVGDEEIFSENYADFMHCYQEIKNCPCVSSADEQSLINCLYLIADAIATNAFLRKYEPHNYEEKEKSLQYIISDSLYRIYDENSYASLDGEYIEHKRLILKQETNN